MMSGVVGVAGPHRVLVATDDAVLFFEPGDDEMSYCALAASAERAERSPISNTSIDQQGYCKPLPKSQHDANSPISTASLIHPIICFSKETTRRP
jgi:hypothetical protein